MTYKEFLPWVDEMALEFIEFECTESLDNKLYSGKSLKDEEPPKIYIKDPAGRPPDFLSGIGTSLPIVSVKVKEFLQGTEDVKHFEFIQTTILDYEKDIEYYILNILDVIDAFDWEQSDYDLFDEPGPKGNKVIEELRKTVLIEEKIKGRNLFYVKDFPSKVFISEKLEAQFVKAGIRDFRTINI
jgi:hypothetical protein